MFEIRDGNGMLGAFSSDGIRALAKEGRLQGLL